MKRLLVFSVIILPLWVFSGHKQKCEILLLEVRSAGLGLPVTFEAAWLSKANGSQLSFIRETTPFNLKVEADTLTAIFSKRAGLSDLQVEMFRLENEEKQPLCMGKGQVIMMFSNLQTHSVFVTRLP